MARPGTPMTADEPLTRTRATLPHRPAPAEALHAQARRALLADIPGDHQRRDGLIPGALVTPRNPLEWRCDPASERRHPALPAGACTSSSSATRETNPARQQRPCSNSA